MDLNKEQLNDFRHAVAYYMYHHVSINSPRYKEYESILESLSNPLAISNNEFES